MRPLFTLAGVALLTAAAVSAFAQGTGTASITVEQPWARATPAGALTSAAYMTLDNKSSSADRLIGVSSDIAAKLQIHEMTMLNGVMQMRQLTDGLPVPAGGSVALKPGSYHIMLIGLQRPLAAGDSFPLTLTFAKAGNVSVTVPVRAMGATPGNSGMGSMPGKPGGMAPMEMK